MKLPMLYARAESGKVLEWEIEIEGPTYRTITGQQGGQKVISAWTTCQAKSVGRANSTTPEQQAEKDAKAQWKKKLKSGGYWESQADIDQQRFIEPMLANKFEEHKHKVKYPVMVDHKYNGMRQLVTAEGPKTRKGEAILTAPHIIKGMQKLFAHYPNLYVDGELYNHDLRFQLNELTSLVRKTVHFTPDDLRRSEEIVKYYVYDGYGFDDVTIDTPCAERRESLKKLFKGAPPMYQVADYKWADNEEEVYAIYSEYVADGYEGAIIRSNTAYEHKRTNALLKVKPVEDDEFKILDINEGEGNWAGKAKIVTVQMLAGKEYSVNGVPTDGADKIFDATFKGPMVEAVKVLKDKQDWIGKTVTVSYNGWTGKGTPNFAQFNSRNCLKGDR